MTISYTVSDKDYQKPVVAAAADALHAALTGKKKVDGRTTRHQKPGARNKKTRATKPEKEKRPASATKQERVKKTRKKFVGEKKTWTEFRAGLPAGPQKFLALLEEQGEMTAEFAATTLGVELRGVGGYAGSMGRWAPTHGLSKADMPFEKKNIDGKKGWAWKTAPTSTPDPVPELSTVTQ